MLQNENQTLDNIFIAGYIYSSGQTITQDRQPDGAYQVMQGMLFLGGMYMDGCTKYCMGRFWIRQTKPQAV
jgi:hypothetical protein